MHLLDMESKCSLRQTETYRPAAAHRVALSGGETKDVLHPANRRLLGAAYIMSRRYTGHTRSDPLWKGRRLCGRTTPPLWLTSRLGYFGTRQRRRGWGFVLVLSRLSCLILYHQWRGGFILFSHRPPSAFSQLTNWRWVGLVCEGGWGGVPVLSVICGMFDI